MTLSCPLDRPTVCRRRSYWLDQNQGTASYSTGWPMISETRSEEHTSELQSLMRISYAVFCLKKKKKHKTQNHKSQMHTTIHTTLENHCLITYNKQRTKKYHK